MGNLLKEKEGIFSVVTGAEIVDTIAEAIALAAVEERSITFEFNRLTVTVNSDSNPDQILRNYERAFKKKKKKN